MRQYLIIAIVIFGVGVFQGCSDVSSEPQTPEAVATPVPQGKYNVYVFGAGELWQTRIEIKKVFEADEVSETSNGFLIKTTEGKRVWLTGNVIVEER